MFKRIQHPAVFLILLTWTLVTLGLPAQTVLCYGADRHVAVEWAHDHCETGETAEHSANTNAAAHFLLSRSSCTDVPVSDDAPYFSTPTPQKRFGVSDLMIGQHSSAALNVEGDYCVAYRTATTATIDFHHPSDLARLRSVILLV